jgi:selenocysteine-specific elongation factor
MAPQEAVRLRGRLVELAGAAADGGGLAPTAAARLLGLPDPGLVAALAAPPLRTEGGRILVGEGPRVDGADARALAALRAELDGSPFRAPEVARLHELGLDEATVGRLHRARLALRLAPGVVLLADAPTLATERLRGLDQPFTAGEARLALGTTRRVALPLLAHLDSSGVTVRLPDDRRRVRG